jgi:arylsulfatase/arylsulfatase A
MTFRYDVKNFSKMAGAGTMNRIIWSFVFLIVYAPRDLSAAVADHPNVLLIITDDQGFGDIGINGNTVVETPAMDRLAREGIQHSSFCVSPVCTPTRASLMTGRYNYRTRAIDTFIGRAMMDPDEVTLAEILRDAGYETGIFGKWHLGDNYPLRATDQGFKESLVHRGGGLAQAAGNPNETYFDPELLHNGKPVASKGYCTDIFADAASNFIKSQNGKPWFTYLAFNAPHDPLQVPEESLKPYLAKVEEIQKNSGPIPAAQAERIARIYAMVSHVDQAIGRVLATLDETGDADSTIVLFLTDNGPAGPRFNVGLRGSKGTVYEGGIRAPLFVRWPSQLKPGVIPDPAAHIDLTPTILDACGVPAPTHCKFDGISLLDRWRGEVESLPERTLFFQWHRGDVPQRYRGFAARESRFKLVQARGTQEGVWRAENDAKFELFDLKSDPAEKTNIAVDHPEVVHRLKAAYDRWFDDVSSTRGYDPPLILVGTDHESPTRLTRQDWRDSGGGWDNHRVGEWRVRIVNADTYKVRVEFPEKGEHEGLTLLIDGKAIPLTSELIHSYIGTAVIPIREGALAISAFEGERSERRGASYLYLERLTAP